MKIRHFLLKFSLIRILATGFLLVAIVNTHAQTKTPLQLPAPTAHVNDFASILTAPAKERIEVMLENLKLRSKVDFYIATVDDTGSQDIFDFSRQLSRTWNLGTRNSRSKSLLLVISVASRSSFTQFSRLVQDDLPEGVLGEMSQRMRGLMAAGQFVEAIDNGVQLFISALAQKIGFKQDDLDKPAGGPVSSNTSSDSAESSTRIAPVTLAEQPATRRRVVSEPDVPVVKTEPSTEPKVEPATKKEVTPADTAVLTSPKPTREPRKKQGTVLVDDDAEAEEVELTLTKPLAQRAALLKEFLDAHPNSKSKARATELLISTHAALGDERLRAGDSVGGIEQLKLAIDEADTSISDKLFTGVIAQIPLNLYLRGEQSAAFNAAQSVEAKFGSDPKRLLSIAGFYLGIERGDEVARLAGRAVSLAPDMADAHRMLAVGLHITLRLEEATAEYKRALELDPNSKGARVSLADLYRGAGKNEEALTLYQEQLKADPKDKAARTGTVLSLLDLGRKDEANNLLEQTLADDPRNLPLLTGAAYWFAAHDNNDKALELAEKAVAIEPRYTWAQIALARALLGLKRPLDAERSIRFARQYGKFPTLNYELANVLASMGLYDEAVEVLRESFVIKDGQIEARLAGRLPTRDTSFIELLAPERRASIYQSTSADTQANAKILKDLLTLNNVLTPGEGEKIDESRAETAAREFGAGADNMKAFREIYGASRLLRNNVAPSTAFALAEDAKKTSEVALDNPVATIAVQADEFRELRARSLAVGTVPDVAQAPRNVLTNIFRGRTEDLAGWALFTQEKYPEAIEHLKIAADILPTGTPSWRTALWHLGVALEQTGSNEEALNNYIKSYTAGESDPVRRAVIEKLYRKINGSLSGLDEKIGPAVISGAAPTPNVTTDAAPSKPTTPSEGAVAPTNETTPVSGENKPATVTETAKSADTPQKVTEVSAKDESQPAATASPSPSPEQTPPVTPAPAKKESPTSSPTEPQPMSDDSLRAAASRLRSTIKITGRVLDSNKVGLANVVVVLISPSGSVLAATTDSEGKYSFTVAASRKAYRVIPSKDGYTFAPIDRTLAALLDDQLEIDFVASANPVP